MERFVRSFDSLKPRKFLRKSILAKKLTYLFKFAMHLRYYNSSPFDSQWCCLYYELCKSFWFIRRRNDKKLYDHVIAGSAMRCTFA